jgi:pseudouridine-5'-phosphate glycosidase
MSPPTPDRERAAGGSIMVMEPLPTVATALDHGRAVVALESTLICHGIPPPANRELAFEIEDTVRTQGAIPATTAVIDGRVRIGLDERQLGRLASAAKVEKCTTRDLPRLIASGGLGATTVAATVFLAARAGIKVMATGGLGGVHRGGQTSLDVSADLDELARNPTVVVCSGVKSILDQGRTLERLETLGVPVVGYGCAELPGFHTVSCGLPVPPIDGIDALTRLVEAHRALGLPGGLIVAQPPPMEHALDRDDVDRWVTEARRLAHEQGIRGPAETPFLLARMAELSAGATVRVNRALVLANARLAATLAVALAGK